MAKSTRAGRRGTGSGETPTPGDKPPSDPGSEVVGGLQDVAQAWVDYARQVMDRTSAATEALLKCRSFNDMLGVQAELMRGHLQAFLDQSSKLAEITNRMAARSIDAAGGATRRERGSKNQR